jgi:ankyrin repeat protein
MDNDSHWIELLNLFIKHPSFREDIFDQKGYAIIHIAAKLQNPYFLQVILGRRNIDLMLKTKDKAQNTALHIACGDHREDNVRLLLGDIRLNPNVGNTLGQSPIHLALKSVWGREDTEIAPIVDMLLRRGADPNFRDKYGMTPLFYCQHEEECRLLLLSGAQPLLVNVNGHNAIQYAKSKDSTEVMSMMIMWAKLEA